MNLAFAYIRVSTSQQDLSVEAQTTTCQRAAVYQQLPLAEEHLFAEPNVSGSIPFLERPVALRMVQTAQARLAAGDAVTVLVPKVDRLGRDTVDVSNTARLSEELGIRLVLLDINVDTRDPMGRAFMQIAAVFAELELSRIRERTKTVLDQKRADGYLPGTLTYGWDAEATGEVTAKGTKLRRVKPNAAEQVHLVHMLEWRAAGRSYYAIAKHLNAEGIKSKTGKAWVGGTVRKLLNSRTVSDWLAARRQRC
jgi:DNA invertase Pin-like site-specific DNA recombinase